jgi:hypothetical protein
MEYLEWNNILSGDRKAIYKMAKKVAENNSWKHLKSIVILMKIMIMDRETLKGIADFILKYLSD